MPNWDCRKKRVSGQGGRFAATPNRYINRLPGRIGPPQKEKGIFRQSRQASASEEEAVAKGIVAEFIKYYNTKRLHSALGYINSRDKLKGQEEESFKA